MSFLKRFQSSLESLYQLPEKSEYVVAYSGGVDSHVLLLCCRQLNLPVRAVHVHHGLQRVADDWVKHCQTVCEQLSVPLEIVYVDAKQKQGLSPEESARNARYDVLHEKLSSGDCLITAQHKNDQAETLLLQLFRTASTAGLAAMPAFKKAGDGVHIRPLLNFSRKEIEAFASENALHWVEDPSNQDISYERNFIRKKLVPELENRWPEITSQLAIVASLQAANLQVQEDMAAIDLSAVIRITNKSNPSRYELVSVLSIDGLKQLSSARQLNVLRYWIIKATSYQPTRNSLNEIEKTLINSQQDTQSLISFRDYEFRKYQGDLYLLKPAIDWSAPDMTTTADTDTDKDVGWVPLQPLVISRLNIKLITIPSLGRGLNEKLLAEPLRVCFRKGGERFHPENRQHSQSLKKLLQEARIPPWDRDNLPLLYLDDELIAVADLWVSKKHAVNQNETGWQLKIEGLSR